MQLTTHLMVLGGEKRWVLATFDEAGAARYSDVTPDGDLYAPVPDVYKTYEAAAAALAVIEAWSEDQSFAELRETEEWAALTAQLAETSVPECTNLDFPDDEEAYEHYEAMIDGGSVVRMIPNDEATATEAEAEADDDDDEEAVEDELAEGEAKAKTKNKK